MKFFSRLAACAARSWLLLPAALWAAHAFVHPFDDDEFQHAGFAWLLAAGRRPFVDFYEHHLPLYHLAAAPFLRSGAGPETLFPLRLASVACALATLWLTWRLARRLGASRGGAGLALVLLSAVPMFAAKMTEVRPEPPAIALLAAAACLVLGLGRDGAGGRRAVFTAGLAAGAAVMLSLKYVFPAAGLATAVFFLCAPRRWPLFLAGGLVPLLLLAAWAARAGVLAAMYESVVVSAVGWRYRFSPAGYASEAFATAGPLLAFGAAGIAALAAGPAADRRAAAGLLCLVAGAVAGILLVPVPYRQTFLPVFPPLAAAAAVLLGRLGEACAGVRGARAAAVVFLGAALVEPAAAFRRTLADSPRDDIRVMRLAEALDPSGGPVFDGRGLLFYRPPVGRYRWMHHELLAMLDLDAYARETKAALASAGYPPVIFDYRVEMMPLAVRDFIRGNYFPLGEGAIYAPGVAVDRADLAEPGGALVRPPVPGRYLALWGEGEITVDGRPLAPGDEVFLGAEGHSVRSWDYIEDLRFVLKERR